MMTMCGEERGKDIMVGVRLVAKLGENRREEPAQVLLLVFPEVIVIERE
jgi:hypothetical protein